MKVKEFIIRNSDQLGALVIFFTFLILGIVLGFAISPHFTLLYLVGVVNLVMMAILDLTYVCFCPNCKEYPSTKRDRFCRLCGGLTEIRRKRIKICLNGHRVEDEKDKYKRCPKCGVALLYIESKVGQPIQEWLFLWMSGHY